MGVVLQKAPGKSDLCVVHSICVILHQNLHVVFSYEVRHMRRIDYSQEYKRRVRLIVLSYRSEYMLNKMHFGDFKRKGGTVFTR